MRRPLWRDGAREHPRLDVAIAHEANAPGFRALGSPTKLWIRHDDFDLPFSTATSVARAQRDAAPKISSDLLIFLFLSLG